MFDRWIRRGTLGLGLAGLGLALALMMAPAHRPAAAGEKDGKGFEPLFNGEDLSGWDGDPELWSVEDGAITGRTTEGDSLPHNKFLIHQGEPVENFVLKMKFRLEGENNTGVQYRSQRLEDVGEYAVGGYQADIHPNPAYLGMLYDEGGRGIVAECGQKVVVDPDGTKRVVGTLGAPRYLHRDTDLSEWNNYTITARGNRLEHRINGQTVAVIIDHQKSEREMSGRIALQVHRGPPMVAQFKDIRLKRLPAGGMIEPGAERRTSAAAELGGSTTPRWIWVGGGARDNQRAYFRQTFRLDQKASSAWLTATCDNGLTVWLNGEKLAEGDDWQEPVSADAAPLLQKGRNVLAIEARNAEGAAGLLGRLRIITAEGETRHIATGPGWRVGDSGPDGWRKPGFEAAGRSFATALAPVGGGVWADRLDFVQAARRGEPVAAWDFAEGKAGWKAQSDCEIRATGGSLLVQRNGNDPYIVADAEADPPAEDMVLRLRARAPKKETWQLFWTTEEHPGTSEGRSVKFEVGGEGENEWGDYEAYFRPGSKLTRLRLDTGASKGEVRIQRIRLGYGARPRRLSTPAEEISVPEGFTVDRLYSVPERQGSWVSLCFDPEGRLIASDQYGGLFRITPAPAGSNRRTRVEKLDAEIGHAQGLLHAFGSLYVVVNGKAAEGGGLYRLTDTNGDDQYDKQELLKEIPGGTGREHGPHSIRVGPDGESLYVIGGNMSRIYEPRTSSRVPEVWDEDQLLPRMPDAGGHATNTMAPGGAIVKTDPDGETWELVCSGFRNPYDFAFNRHGEIFTYDADMEWDIGLPWYRPTRINHAVRGGEHGWRNGSGKWAPYYPDSLPAAVDIGPGSPTGVVFGYDTNFPEPYRSALFICDWSYGKLYTVHLEPDGASYSGEFDTFASASPLPLTDIVVGPEDGALYFAIGGRRTQSGLYRVRYTGDKATDGSDRKVAQKKDSEKARQLRKLRRELESFHRPDAPEEAVEAAWPHLRHEDRFIRFAARIAIEHQDVELWQDRALSEQDPWALIHGMIALARHGEPELQNRMIQALGRLNWLQLDKPQKLALLRAYGLCFIRHGEPDSAARRRVIERLNPRYPADDVELDRELSRLLAYLEAPKVVEKTLALLKEAPSQEEQIHYAYVLRTVDSGWSMEQRREYFSWFAEAGQFAGGMSFSGYLENIKKEAAEKLSDAQKEALSDVLEAEPKRETPEPAEDREFVKNWKVEDLMPAVEDGLSSRDFERGKKMFGAALCFRCHRFDGRGGTSGPDLTGAAGRFTPRDLLEAIINPSEEISDQYQNVIIQKEDGSAVQGRIINLSGNNLRVSPNPMEPSDLVTVNRDKVESIEPSPVSPMPPGLLNTLHKEEVLDLLAYLLSRGDRDHEMFSED